jgi:hypothetical protein
MSKSFPVKPRRSLAWRQPSGARNGPKNEDTEGDSWPDGTEQGVISKIFPKRIALPERGTPWIFLNPNGLLRDEPRPSHGNASGWAPIMASTDQAE